MRNLLCRRLFAPLAVAAGLPAATAFAQGPAPRPLLDAVTTVWTDDAGKDVRLSQYEGQTTVLTMDAPRCEHGSCSMTIDALRDVDHMLAAQGRPAQIVVVSLDPNATPTSLEAMREDAGLAGAKNWHFLIGDLASTQSLAQVLGIRYGEKGGHIIHTFRALILGSDGAVETDVELHPNDATASAAADAAAPDTGGTPPAPAVTPSDDKPIRIVDMLREDEEREARQAREAAEASAFHHRVPALRGLQF